MLEKMGERRKYVRRDATVERLSAIFLEDMAGSVKPSTLACYRRNIRCHILPTMGEHIAAELTAAEVNDFIERLQEDYSPKLVREIGGLLLRIVGTAGVGYKSWFERNVAKRTVAALEARDAAFAEKHADTPLAHLAQYVSNRAELLRHTPSPCEIDGGTFIEERFGSWDAVLEMAHLRPPAKEPKLKDTARYKREKAVQEPLFYEESERKKKEKRAKAAASHAAQQARLKEKKRLEQEKKEARDAAARQRDAERRAEKEAAKAAEQEVSC